MSKHEQRTVVDEIVKSLDRFSVLLAVEDADEALDLATLIESSGYRRVWLPEAGGLEAASIGAVVAKNTSLEVGTAILSVFSRTPAMLSMMAATWSDLGGEGKTVHLGIGAGGQYIVEHWHGQDFDKPFAATRDTLRILRQALNGEKTSYVGTARHSEGFKLRSDYSQSIKIYVGGLGPSMMSLAAEEADGLIVTWLSPRILSSLRIRFDELVRNAGRKLEDERLIARVYVAVTDSIEFAREEVRKELVEYLVSPPYARYFRSVGFEEEVEAVTSNFVSRNRTQAVASISDSLLDEVFVGGRTGDEVVERLNDFLDAGADEVLIQPIALSRGGNPSRTIQEIASILESH